MNKYASGLNVLCEGGKSKLFLNQPGPGVVWEAVVRPWGGLQNRKHRALIAHTRIQGHKQMVCGVFRDGLD